jgi:hypothetical protein
MPKFTVLLGRRTTQVYDIDKPVIRVGRDAEMDVIIDNPSVSRRQAEFRKEGDGWVVEDLGSSNGTFIGEQRITAAHPVKVGDEVGVGKFSIVFDKVVGDAAPAPAAAAPTGAGFGGTTHIKAHEVQDLLKDSQRKRRAHLVWESGGQRGTHYLSDAPAALFGTDALCDVKVPKAPKHHVLVVKNDGGCEVRNLTGWTKMKVGGSATQRARLKDGDIVEVGGLKLTFVADIA